MNNYIIIKGVYASIAMTVLLLLTLSSCKKYLDVPQSSVTAIIRNINDCQLLLNDYTNMNTGYPTDGEASAGDFFVNEAGYVATSPNVTSEDQALYIWQSESSRGAAGSQWTVPYHVVYLANLIMENAEKYKGITDQATYNDIRGQALFYRAFSFWQIAQLYAKPYTAATAGQDPGIPLRLRSDINEKTSRGTVKDTYDRITADLTEAAGLLNPTSSIVTRPNRTSAYAMLARVYLSMEDYGLALSSANSALPASQTLIAAQLLDYNSSSVITTGDNPFTRFTNPEVIFHSTAVEGVIFAPRSGNNNGAKIDQALATSYAANDQRSKYFVKRNADNVTYRFIGNYDGVPNSVYFNGLAFDEVLLIRAECYARANNPAAAMTDLNTLLSKRWVTGTYVDMTATDAKDALDKVLTERRKELLMRGLRWSDLRRLNRDSRYAVTLSRTINGEDYKLPPNDLRYTLLIPRDVIRLSGYEQNLR